MNVFYILTLKPNSSKTETFFKKLEYSFLVVVTRIENTLFPYKTIQSKINVMTNRMRSTRWTYHEERSFASNYFIFLKRKIFFSIRTSYKVLIWCTNHLNLHIHTFRKLWGFIWGYFFPLSILKGSSSNFISNISKLKRIN